LRASASTRALVSGLAVFYPLGANKFGLFYDSSLAGQPIDMEIMPGAAYSRAISAVNGSLVAETLSLWVVAPLVASSLAFVLVRLI